MKNAAQGITKTRTIGLISAVRLEGSRYIKTLRPVRGAVSHLSPPFFSGRLSGIKAVYAVSGIGKVNAAHATTLMIERFQPDLIINFGVGGAYPSSGMSTGDVAIARREIYADEGIHIKNDFLTLEAIGIPLVRSGRKRWFNDFLLENRSTRKVLSHSVAAFQKERSYSIKTGAFATVSACTGTAKRAREIERRLGVICENMEGAAVAHICAIYGVPMIEIRGISNLVEDRNRDSWDIETAADHCQQTVADALTLLAETDL